MYLIGGITLLTALLADQQQSPTRMGGLPTSGGTPSTYGAGEQRRWMYRGTHRPQSNHPQRQY